MTEKSKESSTLNIKSELNLSSIQFPKVPKDITVNEELNNYLRDQLTQMKRENETLRDEISSKQAQIQRGHRKIEELSEKVSNYENCCTNDLASATQVANSKIIELSKKLREKNSEVEVYKTKCTKLESSLTELQAASGSTCNVDEISGKCEKPLNEPDEMKKVQEKLTYVTNKWIEEKNSNLQLKNDLKRANKWLQQEVGEKFESLLALNNANANWRGRAQIICDLQKKNQELRDKLRTYQENNKDKSAGLENTQPKYDNKKMEALTNENLELKNSYGDLKKKFDALKARCKVLENEYGLLKTKVITLSEVHEADQQTVANLTTQMSYYNDLRSDDLKQKDQVIKNLQQENEMLQVELVREKCLSENKSKELLEKNDDLQLLNKRIRSSRPPSSYLHRPENPDTKLINKLEVERLRLLELTEVQNTRLQEERNCHFKTQQVLRTEKQKTAKLEASLARLQLEMNSSRPGYSSRTNVSKQSDFDLKDKLELAEENIKALTTRLEIESMERKRDLKEFGKILKNCQCSCN